jgi:hypothetical protein
MQVTTVIRPSMSDYVFYLDIDPIGKPHAVFRAPKPNGFERGVVERAMPDGSWSGAEQDVRYLFNLWLKGDFDPKEDEIPEAQVIDQIAQWRTTGTWPGRGQQDW